MSTERQWDIVSGVGITALAVAAARAVEASRPDAVARDTYAARFVEEAHAPLPLATSVAEAAAMDPTGSWPAFATYAGVRTRAFDEHFERAVEAGVTQAVVLASGLDTRAFRLRWPSGAVCYELDQPLVLDFKLNVLRGDGVTPTVPAHRPVAVDLRHDWAAALEAAGFDRTRPTAWLAEGLLPYLPPEAEESLFREIHRLSAPGSLLAVEYYTDLRQALDSAEERTREWARNLEIMIHTDPRPTPGERLGGLGWETRDVPVTEAAREYGRALDVPAHISGNAVFAFARRG
ncbi:SAM-dependent methyltransferase [Streptomyces sp. AV19]|uniref:SAM-dependent methyltransferase n=1 Tax=Streptomyces sp. AV19 TaxID=2793068 RepID=UPI0018FF00BE|nr:SAM-dependent methyltransferase [Streptomyces sp. AV19]MBH1933734.1 SAM-dependent methyltransferase [Streptomyces sp. AV19]MDG4535761.1 SAM-dependent methyltransferase [Streptomyces sp. AV19]